VLEVRDIHAYYGVSHVIQGVSLEVQKGEIITLIGRNGAGKTTTLKSILGIVPPKSGAILFEGREITRWPTHLIVQRGIAYVPEERRIIPNLTVEENLRLGMLKNRDRSKNRALLDKTFDYFPRLKERLRQRGNSLSGGEQQMLAISRALMTRPRLLLFDEPSLGLAPIIVEQVSKIIRDIHGRGTTVLLVEQNAFMALRLAGRGYVLENGRIVMEGETSNLMADEHVKTAYLGSTQRRKTRAPQP